MDGPAGRRRARQSIACHSMAWRCVLKHCNAKRRSAKHGIAQRCTTQHRIACRGIAPDDFE
eukprot:5191388-Pyramimonas_sp.AAC.1